MYYISSELYNNFLEIYYDEFIELQDAKKRRLGNNYDPKNLFLKGYDYSVLSKNKEELDDKEKSVDFFVDL